MPSLPSLPEVGEAVHGFAEQVAAVRVPSLHEDVPDTVYPELHVGWHVDPLARELVQSPTPPFEGGADASHVVGTDVQMFPPLTPTASFVPSLEDEKPNNFLLEMLSVEVLSIQLIPESVEVQILVP